LAYLLPGESIQSFIIPDFKALVLFKRERKNGRQKRPALSGTLNLDTLIINTDSENPEDWRVNITWRSRTPKLDEVTQIETTLIVPDSLKTKIE